MIMWFRRLYILFEPRIKLKLTQNQWKQYFRLKKHSLQKYVFITRYNPDDLPQTSWAQASCRDDLILICIEIVPHKKWT